ncbi:MAG: bifunctional methylenetetrahydrofolate dehydrogenase/methenyltetrahydrofolate cyclohydrolase FolD [Bacteroidetes bacterium]|nr:bifunctional methylenetetrahydrofolate dehydrogenase/methenyltetrahydrofolate cyclohydrolase FolD [Bacteroidota bacterium]
MKIIDGKAIAAEIRNEIKKEVAAMIDAGLEAPHLAAILIGDDPASHTYVNNKEKACREVGITSSVYRQSDKISEKELLDMVDFLNNDDDIDGFIVQLPLPAHIREDRILERIKPSKDVDGFHPVNLGRMIQGLPSFISATPMGIVELIKRAGIETEGKHCVVAGRSNIVGTPVSILLSRKSQPGDCTVTLCHSRTKNLEKFTSQADILIAAIGKPQFFTGEMVKKDAVVIDVGIHRVESESSPTGYKMVGDVNFEEVSKKASFITPVPGGVGPMTIVSLLMNTLKAARKEIYG